MAASSGCPAPPPSPPGPKLTATLSPPIPWDGACAANRAERIGVRVPLIGARRRTANASSVTTSALAAPRLLPLFAMSRSKADGTLDPALGAASVMNLPVPYDSRFGNHGAFARRGPRPAGTFARSDHGRRPGGGWR